MITTEQIQVIQIGLGALGRRLTAFLAERPYLKLVGAVDPNQELVGRELGEAAGLAHNLGITISPDLASALAGSSAQVALHTTVSSLRAAVPQLGELLERGLHVVSSCEELSYPWSAAPEISAELDQRAKQAGRAVLATGVNPGFLMDLLPLAFTAICRRVDKVTVRRYQDARFRRLPFQQKIGAGLTLTAFEENRISGSLRHVGLTESIHMIASQLGWKLDRTVDDIQPVIAHAPIQSAEITVQPGMATGVYQVGSGFVGAEERIRLEFRACLGETEVQDTVIIEGEPTLRWELPGGANGDVATCAILVNAISTVLQAQPGLHTMADVPPITWCAR